MSVNILHSEIINLRFHNLKCQYLLRHCSKKRFRKPVMTKRRIILVIQNFIIDSNCMQFPSNLSQIDQEVEIKVRGIIFKLRIIHINRKDIVYKMWTCPITTILRTWRVARRLSSWTIWYIVNWLRVIDPGANHFQEHRAVEHSMNSISRGVLDSVTWTIPIKDREVIAKTVQDPDLGTASKNSEMNTTQDPRTIAPNFTTFLLINEKWLIRKTMNLFS